MAQDPAPPEAGGPGSAPEEPDPFAEAALEEDPVAELQRLYRAGDYTGVVEWFGPDRDLSLESRDTVLFLVRALTDLGRWEEALAKLEEAPELHRTAQGQHIRYQLERSLGQTETAEETLERLRYYRRYLFTPDDALAYGRALLLSGLDPKEVLDGVYKEMLQQHPEHAACHLYAGELALEKDDHALAAEHFRSGLKLDPGDPDLRLGLARAFFTGDRPYALELLEALLADNPRNAPALLLLAEHQLLTDDFEGAGAALDRVEAVNARIPDTWAMRAVLAHLRGDGNAERSLRERALKDWPANPEVDLLMGRWMATKMRFGESVAALRRALEKDPEHVEAQAELAQQLLRLGDEDEAWELVEKIHDADPYNVPIYNLLTLYDQIRGYSLERRGEFVLRMEEREMEIYGKRVLELLEEARAELHPRYGFTPAKPVLVEFFPEQQDFAIRTFGFLGGDGILGACFGYVVTMNSPGGMGARVSNWESTLWHEYCHAVSLGVTGNRIPRWLSEGISVFEEGRRDPGAVRRLGPDYRERILGERGLIPLATLNDAFVRPEQPDDLLFAYFQGGLFVEYFVAEYGETALRRVLESLRRGRPLEQAFGDAASGLGELETGFTAYARARAEAIGPDLDWSAPAAPLGALDVQALQAWVSEHPDNYQGLLGLGGALLAAGRLDEARATLESLVARHPESPAMDPAYAALAEVHQRSGDTAAETRVLRELAARSAENLEALLRLLELEAEAGDWEKARGTAARALSVNPFVARAQWRLGESEEELGNGEAARSVYGTLLRIGPENPSQVHYRLARLERETDPESARRHILEALAGSPRYRDAHRLLLELAN